jgi:A/G-specific adenine glycosylase
VDGADGTDGTRMESAPRRVAEGRAAYAADASPTDVPTAARARKRQSQAHLPFIQTSRYFRGRVLAALRDLDAGESLSLEDLGSLVKPEWTSGDLPWLRGIVMGLQRDGLARVDPPAARGSGAAAAQPIRVRLP